MTVYVAFIRAINVGGNSLITVDSLISIFTKLGCKDILNYGGTGNIRFSSTKQEAVLEKEIENILSKLLNKPSSVMVRKQEELKELVKKEPFGNTTEKRLCATFVKDKPKKLPRWTEKKNLEFLITYNNIVCSISYGPPGQGGDPNSYLEKTQQTRATTRSWNVVKKMAER